LCKKRSCLLASFESFQDVSFLEVTDGAEEGITLGKKGDSDATTAAKTVFQVENDFFTEKTKKETISKIKIAIQIISVQSGSCPGNARRARQC